jgi:hypothetical protein
MFRPHEAINCCLIEISAPRQYIYMLPLHVVIVQECMPALHSRYFLVAASMLFSIVRSLPCRVCLLYYFNFTGVYCTWLYNNLRCMDSPVGHRPTLTYV